MNFFSLLLINTFEASVEYLHMAFHEIEEHVDSKNFSYCGKDMQSKKFRELRADI